MATNANWDKMSRMICSIASMRIYNLPNGGKAFQADVPARNIIRSYATYEKQIDVEGITLSYTKTTYAPDGTIIHVKQKYP